MRDKWSFKHLQFSSQMLIGVTFPLLLIVVLGIISSVAIGKLNRLNDIVGNTYQVLSGVKSIGW
ncbi:MAG: hypothetical protein P1U74_04470 [Legionellaceae bacterium]|nr:hypothetical protein [Legionellaceae bacterium]